ncbi:MAG: hypothetical protein DI551_11600 [Micavibrio aeruginosavorus]|uniref:Uncharacterized protein n=1 Tax=Micavibrio aeruginosavorus TaxID=349221 RepID=A0A2W5MR56_9BACT|nr:MAG: hypothetical protein DI551_11600 [Micavibrio aeruginosavorus]
MQLRSIFFSFIFKIRNFIEFCGRHPFATGLFAIIGLCGLVFSIYAYIGDMKATQSNEEHARAMEKKLANIESNINNSNGRGVFLYEEKVEMYWNNWWAQPINLPGDIKTDGPPELQIIGSGKTVNFSGILDLQCESRVHYWRSTTNHDTPVTLEEIDSEDEDLRIVPPEVYKAAFKLFCF